MKLKLPHKLQAALMAAIASVSFTTLSSGTITAAGVAFFGHQAFADDTADTADADDPDGTIDTGDTNLDAQAAIDEEEGTGKAKEPDSAPINMAGFNGGPGNNAGLLATESVDIDEAALVAVAGSGQQGIVSGTADATPSTDFTANPYDTGSDTSNGSDDFSLTGTAPAAAYVPGQSGISAEEGDSAAGTGSGSSTNKTATGAIGSIGGIGSTGSGAIGGSMALTASNLGSPVSNLSVGGTSLGGDSGSASPELALSATLGDAGSGAAASTNLGKFLFMGDSITHGVVDQTYRWQMFKGFVDNGISFDFNGPKNGYSSAPTNMNDAGSAYGNVTFENVHYAESSGRAYQMISGQNHYVGWPVSKVGQTDYDTYTLMIGTNDILSDTGDPVSYATYADKFDNLLGGTVSYTGADKSLDAQWTWTKGSEMSGNLNTILNSLNLNAGDTFYVISVPVWAERHNNHNNASDHAAVAGYNTMLQQWVQAYNETSPATVKYVDVNKGITDVTVPERGGVGPFDFFSNNDRLHPSQQGSIIIGGNLSRGMGLAGRTAGLHRAATTGWTAADSPITLASGDSQEIARDVFIENGGYTIDFHATFGNGALEGWLDAGIHTGNMNAAAQNVLAITIGDGINGGTLNLAEGYIMWGSNILYCQDNSQSSNDAIRIAYHNGSTADNVAQGYYVWLGDMLIGQGLSSTPGLGWNGIRVSSTGGTATLTGLMYTDTAYAPETDFAVGSNPYYVTQDRGQTVLVPTREAAPNHHADPISSGVDYTSAKDLSEQSAINSGNVGSFTGGKAVVNMTHVGGWFAVSNATATLDIDAKFESKTSDNTLFAVQGGTTTGSILVDVKSATIKNGTYGPNSAAVAGSYNGAKLTGCFSVYVDNSTINGDMVGGTLHGTGSVGSVNFVINSGTVNGNIYGGSKTAGTVGGDVAITINDGTVDGSIFGGGTAGTVSGDANITINGGIITGDINGGSIAGTSSVTVTSYKPLIKGNITADNVTLSGVTDTEYAGYMDTYRGTVTANSSIILDDYTAKDVMAKLVTQDLTVSGTTETTIHDLTLTSCSITAEEGTDLTLADSLTLGNSATFSGNITLADGLVIDMTSAGEHQGYSDGDNGYLNNVVVFKQADGAAAGSSIEADWSTIQGAGALQGATFSQDASGKVTAGGMTTGSYHITTGTVYYGGPNAPEDIKTAHDLILEPTSSATLVMASNFEPDCVGGISVAAGAQGARLRINAFQEDGTTPIVILASNVHANAGLVLEGDGTYALSNLSGYTAGNGYGLGANVSLDPAWKGTVLVSSSTSTDKNNLIDFSKLGNSLSTVELNGLTGWATNWTGGTIEQNIKLTNNDGAVAWKNSASNSTGTIPNTNFTGTWSGDGTFEVAPGSSNQRSNYTFSGDISAWTGKLLRSGAGTTVFTFAGDAHEVNADIERTGGNVSLVVNTDTVFKKNVTDINNGLTVANGKHATFNGTTSISGASTIGGTIYNNGAMTLAGTGTVNLSGNEGAFELYNEAGGNTYSNGDSGYLKSGSAYYYLIKGGENSTLSGSPTIANTTQVGNSLIVSGTADTGLYYVNRDLSYSDDMDKATGFVIKAGTTLSATSSAALPTPTKQLHGEGTYALNSGDDTLHGNPTIGSDWTGTVKLSGINTLANINLDNYGRAGSKVEFDNVAGHFLKENKAFSEVMVLSGDGLTITNGYSNYGYTFAGGVEGAGNFKYGITSSADSQTYIFTGDVSNWTGTYESTVNKTSTLKFYGQATKVGAEIKRSNGTINIEVGDGTNAFSTTFDRAVSASKLEVKNGAGATMAANATISGVTTNNGNLVLRDGTTYTVHATSGGQAQALGNIVVEKSATIVDTNFNATMNFTTITGGENGTLTLLSSHSAATSEWNLGVAGQSQVTPFGGKLVLMAERDGKGNRAANFNFVDGSMFSGAEVQIKNGTDSGIILTNTLKLKAASVTIGGLSDAAAGTVASDRIWSVTNESGQSSATLALNGHGTYATDIKLAGGVNLAMSGEGSQAFTGDLSAMNGTVSVSAGTLTLANSGTGRGTLASVTVTGGTLNLDNMNVTGATEVTGGMLNLTSSVQTSGLTVATGTTLKLAGEGMLTVGGTLTLQAGSTLDLARIFETQEAPVQDNLFQAAPKANSLLSVGGNSGDSGLLSGGLLGAATPAAGATYVLATANEIDLASSGINLQNLADGYRGTLSIKDATGGSGQELILTLAELSKNLIWGNHESDNQWSTSANWHTEADDTIHIAFTDGDNVRFTSSPSNPVPVLNAAANAGTMTIDSGVNLTLNTNGNDLSVSSLVSTAGGNFKVNGGGSVEFGGSGDVTVAGLNIAGDNTVVSFDGKVIVTGDTRPSIGFENPAATGVTVKFNGGYDYTGGNSYGLLVGAGDKVYMDGTSDLSDKKVGLNPTAQLVLDEGASLSVLEIMNSVTNEGRDNGKVQMNSGSRLTVNGGWLYANGFNNEGGTLVLKNGSNVNLYAVDYRPIQVFDLGDVALDENAANTIYTKNHGGTVKLDSISGSGTLTLKANSGSSARNTFSIGGNATEPAFTGKIALQRTTGKNRVLLAEFNDEWSAAGAVVEASLDGSHTTEAVGIAINNDTVKMKGLNDGAGITSASSYALFSGSALNRPDTANDGAAGYLNNASDSTARTLEFVGTDATASSSTAIKVLNNVNLKMSSAGSQSFTGDLSAMNGTVTVNNGTLTLDNTNSNATAGSLASVIVNGGTLVLDDMNVSGAVTLGSGTLDLLSATSTGSLDMDGGTLKLHGTNGLTSTTGNLDFTSGMLDLTGMDIQAGNNYTLATTTGGNLTLGNVVFTLSDSTLKDQFSLRQDGNSLVLTFVQPVEPKNLIWDNDAGNDTWDAGASASANWHEAESPDHIAFTNHDNATFASADATVTMSGAVTAGTMTVGSGADVTIVTGAGNTLSVTNGITIEQGGTLAQQGNGLSGTLKGAGTYDQTGKSLGSVQLGSDSDWTGAVRLTNQELNSTGPNQKWLAGLRNENSWIEMNGFTGYDSSWASSAGSQWGNLTANIRLLDGEDGNPAWKFNASAAKGYTMNATGKWEGDGTFLMSTGTSTQSQAVTFTGDISRWTGLLATDAAGERTVTFAGNANKVNAEIDTLGSGALNVVVDNAATFSKNVDATKLTINSGKSATLTGGAQIDTLAGEGKLVVDGANTTTTIGSGTDFSGAIDLLGGTLDLTSALTGVGAVNLGTGSSAATLKLAGGDTAALTSTGTITLGNNLTFDLGNYNSSLSPVEGGTTSVTLATATSGFGDSALDAVSLTGLSLEEGYKATLSVVDTTKLVLTISDESKNLVWLDAAGTWTAKNSWYQNDQQTRNTFQNGDSVTIVGGKYDEDTTIRMVADASARNMTVTNADDVSDATVIIQDSVNENRLAAKTLELEDGVTLVTNTQLEVTESMVLNNNTKLKLNSPKDATISADISAAEGAQNVVITKQGDNTLTLTGDNTYYNGAIDVTDGTLVAQGTSSLGSSSVIVEDGAALSLAARDSMWGITLDLKGNSTITFLGDTELTLYGSLTLGDNVTWDLSRYGFDRPAQGETTATATLIHVENINQASIDRLLATTSDYINTPGIVSNARLSYDSTNSSVILTYDMDSQGDLFWMGGVGNWNGNSDNLTWYPMREGGDLTQFYKGDNVTFDNRAAVSPVTLTEDITAGKVTVENGTSVTLRGASDTTTLTAEQIDISGTLGTQVNVAAGTVNIQGTGTWNVSDDKDRVFAGELAGTGTLAKSGTGDLELAHSNTAFTGEIQLNEGSITAADADALGGAGATIAMGDGTELKGSALNMGGKTIEVANVGTSATVSANLDVAQGTILTFAGDGNLAVTQAVTGRGTLTQTGYGTLRLDDVDAFQGSIVINQGGVALGSATNTVDSINVGINTALTFAGSGMMDINTLTLANGSTVDLSNVTFTNNHATLAIVSTLNAPVSGNSGGNYYCVEGVAAVNAQGLDEGSVVRLRYQALEGGKTEFYAEIIPQPDKVVFWKGAGENDPLGYPEGSGIWRPTNTDLTQDEDRALGYLVDKKGQPTVFEARNNGGTRYSSSINFFTLYDSNGDLIEEATVNVQYNTKGSTGIEHIRTMIIDGETRYIIQAENNAAVNEDIQLSSNAVSTLIVKSGAQAEIRDSFASKDASLVLVEEGAKLDYITADAKDRLDFSFMENRGEVAIQTGMTEIARLTNSGTISIEGRQDWMSEGYSSSISLGEVVNTGNMVLSGDGLYPAVGDMISQNVIVNEGNLTYMGQDNNPSLIMVNALPTLGRGIVDTAGDKPILFDQVWSYAYATVEASELNIGAASTTFNYGVDITDTTTVKAGKDAYFYGGTGVGRSGSLGEVTLEAGSSTDKTTITFGPRVEVAYGEPEITEQTYDMGHVTAGADSVLTVQKGATVTMDGFNAASGVPAGKIVVGTMPADAPTSYAGTASLTIDGPAAVDTVRVLDGTATITGRADINQIMQDGGELVLNSNSILNGVPVSAEPDAALTGGTVTGGTLKLGTGVTLDQNAVIDVRDGGAYTVSGGTGSRIDATGLELIVDRSNTLYREVVKDDGKPVISDDALANRSGFISSGDEYVKLFDMAEGTTLTAKSEGSPQGEAVYHASASGMMTLIGTDNWAAIQASIGEEATFDVQGHIGYGYLHTADLALKTYYVRDAYASANQVTLRDIVTASIDPNDPLQDPQLANVVFDKTDYNKNATPYNGTLTVDANVAVDLFSVSSDAKAAINIAGGTTVTANADSPGMAGQMDLQGSGVYEIQDRNDLGTNIALRDDTVTPGAEWDGTVRVTGTSTDLTLEDKSVGEGTDASTIEFKDWNGALNGGEHTSDGKIVLTSTQDSPTAMKLTGEDDINYTFTNTVSGSGNIDHAEGGNVAMTFTGDTSGWNGTYEQLSDTEDSLTFTGGTTVSAKVTSGNGTMDLTYGGEVTMVAGDVNVYSGGDTPTTMNVAYTGADKAVTGGITSDAQSLLTLTVGDGKNPTTATFTSTFTGTENATMAVQSGSTATIGTATIGTNAELLRVVGDEGSNVVVNSGSTLSLASTDPETGYSEFHNLSNAGTIEMKASGGDIRLVDDTTEGNTYNLGELVLTDPVGTATIETSGVEGKTTNVNISGLVGPKSADQVLELMNGNATGTVNYNLGNTDDTKDLNGTIAYGVNGGNSAVTNLVIQDNGNSAASAVLETRFANANDPAEANIVVDTHNGNVAHVLGLSSDANSFTDNKTMVVSGSAGGNKTLEITGVEEYDYAGKLGENLDITYSGDGKQTIAGGVDHFNGAVTVDNNSSAAGVLEILNASSVNITDLTIGASDTLDLNNGSNVGTAVVSGTMKAGGTGGTPSKLDGSLTLNDTAIYDVSASGGTGGLQLTGALTIETGAKLSTNDLTGVLGLGWFGMYDLAWDVDDMSSFGVDVDWTKGVDASTVFGNGELSGRKEEFYIRYSTATGTGGNGNNVGAVYIYRIPEPTTGTLSLLALAALAARRRRK